MRRPFFRKSIIPKLNNRLYSKMNLQTVEKIMRNNENKENAKIANILEFKGSLKNRTRKCRKFDFLQKMIE